MAWKNLDRNRTRTIITISAIFFAILLAVITSSLRAGIFDQLVDNITRSYTGKIQIHAKGYWDEPSLEKTFLRDPPLESYLRDQWGMRSVVPRLETFVLAASDRSTKGAQLVGFDPLEEDRLTSLRSRLASGIYPDTGYGGVLVAEGMLNRIGSLVGDTLVLLGQGYQGALAAAKYPVIGSLHFGSPDWNDHLIMMPLRAVQEFLTAEGRLTSYVLDPINDQKLNIQADSIERHLSSLYEVMPWTTMMPDVEQHIRTDTRNMRIVQRVLYLLVSFGIFGTLLMLMTERLHEFGMLLALGLQKFQLAGVLIWELMFVFGLGILFGSVASVPLVFLLHTHPIRLHGPIAAAYERFGFEAVFPTSTNLGILGEQALMVLGIGFILSIYLIYRVFQLNPVNAMR